MSAFIEAPASGPAQRYVQRMCRVIDHVYDHLDSALDLDVLAEVACMSPHHWHRIYQSMYGETLARTVRRLRLHRAAAELAYSALPLTRIARRAAYPSLPSFSRTFKAAYGVPPARYRALGQHRNFALQQPKPPGEALQVRIEPLPAMHLLGIAHQGSYMLIGRAFDRLFAHTAASGLLQHGPRCFGLYLDDPSRVPERLRRSVAAIGPFTAPPSLPHPELQPYTTQDGPYATLLHRGPYDGMHASYRWLLGQWLPHSDYDAADGPLIEEYLNNPRDTAPSDLLTRIHLPLRAETGQS